MGRAGEEEEEDNIFAPSHLLAYSEVGKKKEQKRKKKEKSHGDELAIHQA